MPGDPSTSAYAPVPQADGPGLFVWLDTPIHPTRDSMMGEDIVVDVRGDVWFTQGGTGYYDGMLTNPSRIIRYSPGSGQFRCYVAPVDNAQVIGVEIDEARGVAWYAESSLTDGNAITSFDFNNAPSDCFWTPAAPNPSKLCAVAQIPGCHQRYLIPRPYASPAHLALDGDGFVWFTEYWASAVGRLDPYTGDVREIPFSPAIVRQGAGLYVGSGPWELRFGSDGALWVSEYFDGTLLRIDDPTAALEMCPMLDEQGLNPCAEEVLVGSDGMDGNDIHTLDIDDAGRVWFGWSSPSGARIGLTFEDDPSAIATLEIPGVDIIAGITANALTGDIWFADYFGRRIGRLRTVFTDGDGIPTPADNCPVAYNPGQENHDGNYVDAPSRPFDDITWPNSDSIGDACDPDADNDGITNVDEAALPSSGCPAATAATDPLLADTDRDRVLDGAECALGSDPTRASSYPAKSLPYSVDPDRDGLATEFESTIGSDPASNDSDGDRISDGVEFKFYNTRSAPRLQRQRRL